MGKVNQWVRSLFIPQEENNFRARILSPAFLAFFVGIFLFTQTFLSFLALTRPGVLGYSADITPERIIELVNQERQKTGLEPLIVNSLLNEAAQRKAADMFAFNYWAHISPSGRTPWMFFKDVGYHYVVAGENLAKDFVNAEGVVDAWMKSPTHRDNILDPRFKEIGIAVVDGTLNGIKTTLVVQLFGTPLSAITTSQKTEPKPVFAGSGFEESKEGRATGSSSFISPETSLLISPETNLSSGEALARPAINPLSLTKAISGFIFILLTAALIIDALIVWRKKVYRVGGRNIAHAGFLAIIFLFIILSQQGVIN